MKPEEKYLRLFDYSFDKNLIAQKPASPRDSARLLIYRRKTKKLEFNKFSNIVKYLPKNSVLVFNQTKVIPARLEIKKETGGHAHILYLKDSKNNLAFLSDRKLSLGSKIFMVISGNRNLWMSKYPYGYKAKERFQLCGQL